MNKKFTKALSVLLALLLIFAFAACGGEKTEGEGEGEQTPTIPTRVTATTQSDIYKATTVYTITNGAVASAAVSEVYLDATAAQTAYDTYAADTTKSELAKDDATFTVTYTDGNAATNYVGSTYEQLIASLGTNGVAYTEE